MPDHSQVISLAELGPILKHYADLMGFNDHDRLWEWYSNTTQQQIENQYEFATSKEEFEKRLDSLYDGSLKDRLELRCLQKLLRAFRDPNVETDMPGLMAEWLEAEINDFPLLKLKLPDGAGWPRLPLWATWVTE